MEWLDSCCLSSLRGIRRPALIQVWAMRAGQWRREERRISDFNRFSDFGRFGFWMALAAPGGVPEDALHRAVRSGIKITQIGLCGQSFGRNPKSGFNPQSGFPPSHSLPPPCIVPDLTSVAGARAPMAATKASPRSRGASEAHRLLPQKAGRQTPLSKDMLS